MPHAARGRAYSEKARYSRAFKLISLEDYGRLFDLAIKDHERAIALSPADATLYLSRGRTYYDRAVLENGADPKTRVWFTSAQADFCLAIPADGSDDCQWQGGLTTMSAKRSRRASVSFGSALSAEMLIAPLGGAPGKRVTGSARQLTHGSFAWSSTA